MKYHWLRLCLVVSIFGVTGAAYAKDPKDANNDSRNDFACNNNRCYVCEF